MNPSTDAVNTVQALDFQREQMTEHVAAILKAAGAPAMPVGEAQVGAMCRANNLLCEALSILYGEVDQ